MARQHLLALALVAVAAASGAAATGLPEAPPPMGDDKDFGGDLKGKVEGFLGDALSAKQAAVGAVKVKEASLGAKLLKGYPFDLYPDCIRTAEEYVAAYKAGVNKCVAPWIFVRAPDSPADVLNDPEAAFKFIKGPQAALAFVSPGPSAQSILTLSADCNANSTCTKADLLRKILANFAIAVGPYPPGTVVPIKIFGSDASIFLGTNKAVTRYQATWTDAFDTITREFSLDPRLLGTYGPLRDLAIAYTYSNSTEVAFEEITGCPPGGTPGCSDLARAAQNQACLAYAAQLASFCAPASGGTFTQNYNTRDCVAILKTKADPTTGTVSTIAARAFYQACFDMVPEFVASGFNPPNNKVPPIAPQDVMLNREYLVTGDALLAQAGGFAIIPLTV